jgi:hypothetical protein
MSKIVVSGGDQYVGLQPEEAVMVEKALKFFETTSPVFDRDLFNLRTRIQNYIDLLQPKFKVGDVVELTETSALGFRPDERDEEEVNMVVVWNKGYLKVATSAGSYFYPRPDEIRLKE